MGSNLTISNLLFWPFSCFHFLVASIRNQQSSSSGSTSGWTSHHHQLTPLLCVIVHQVKMSSSISKSELLTILMERGFTSPIPQHFVVETENILFEKLHLDRDTVGETIVSSICESARRFCNTVREYYGKYQELTPILNNGKHTVRIFTSRRWFFESLFR